jgi:hypothetical protein
LSSSGSCKSKENLKVTELLKHGKKKRKLTVRCRTAEAASESTLNEQTRTRLTNKTSIVKLLLNSPD